VKILYISLEFSTWQGARSLSYSGQLGLEEGFEANNLEYLTIPAIQGIPAHFPASWLSHVKRICDGRTFDQVWIELVHTEPGEELLEWLVTVAPVRIGLILESLEFDEEIYTLHPPLRNRKAVVDSRLRFMTHALAVDEADVDVLNRTGRIKALWWPQAIPERYISEQPATTTGSKAIFGGASYAWRQRILDFPSLSPLLEKMPSPESSTGYPALFDEISRLSLATLNSAQQVDGPMLSAFLTALRTIRRECFGLWLKNLGSGCAVVNLPGYIKSYPGRVVEGMATGRPIISAEVPDRPRTKALFKHGEEILLFPQDRPDILEQHIRKLHNEPDFARQLAANARATLWRFHTMEKRVRQILDWVQSGIEPCYHESSAKMDLHEALQCFAAVFSPSRPVSQHQPLPDGADLAFYSGMISAALERRDTAEAQRILEQIVHLEPQLSELLMSLCIATGFIDKAAAYNLIAIANAKPNVEILLAGCEIAAQQNNPASGYSFLKEAFRLNPSAGQLDRLLKYDFKRDRLP